MKHAYLTCELKSRDLDSRLLIAARLLARGVATVIGQQWAIFENGPSLQMTRGAVLFKTANRIQAVEMEKLRAAGHAILLMDEELLSLTNEYVIRLVTDARAIAACDYFLFQDAAHETLVRQHYRADVPGRIAGNSRVDLLRSIPQLYEAEARAIAERGPYILINTNFTLTNSIWGDVDRALAVARAGGAIETDTERGRAYAIDWLKTETENAAALKAVMAWMQQHIKSHRLIVRPHPAEKASTWSSTPGIEIAPGTTPAPWILGADLVIHTNSTTGLEAALMGRPCLNLCPLPNSEFSTSYVARQANFTATTVKDANETIGEFIKHRRGPIRRFKNPVQFHPDAARIIAEDLDRLSPEGALIGQWRRYARDDVKREKFSVSLQEFMPRMKAIFGALNVAVPQVAELDDSVFYLVPG